MTLSEEMRVRMPLKLLVTLLGIVALGAITWASTRSTVEAHEGRIQKLEHEAHSNREVLIRIDERTAEIKRQMDRAQ